MGEESGQRRVVGGRYSIERTLGDGGFGHVFLASARGLDTRVVVKQVPLREPRLAAVFKREATILRKIDSPNAARFVDYFVDGDSAYLVQEYVEDAIQLDAWLPARPLAVVLRLFADLAGALAALHEKGYAHRDVKPSNVLVRADHPVLIDFGLTVDLREPDALTQSAVTVVGTPLYMAPEAIRGGAELGPPADVYALGLIVHHALTGAMPEGAAVSVTQLLTERGTRAPLIDRGKLEPVAPLADLLARMLALGPEARPAAREVRAAFEAELDRLAKRPEIGALLVPLASTGMARPSAAPSFATMSSAPPVPIAAPPSSGGELAVPRRWRSSLGVAGAALIALVVFGVARGLVSPLVIIWMVLLAFALVATIVLLRARRPKPEAPTPEMARRIAAIELHVAQSRALTDSLAVNVEALVASKLEHAIRESVLVALKELLPAAQPTTELSRALALLEKLAVPARSKKPLHERLTAFFALPAAAVAVCVSCVGLLAALDVWHPSRPPGITSLGAEHLRVRPGGALFLTVDARDPDGDPLTYHYAASAGTCEGQGTSVRWTAPADPTPSLTRISVEVSDGRHTVTKQTSIAVEPPPDATLVIPAEVGAGGAVQLRVVPQTPQTELKYEWRVSGGTLLQTTGAVVFWQAPAGDATVEVVCDVSDALGSIAVISAIRVKK